MGTDPCNDLVCPAEKREEGGWSPICLFCKLIKDGLGRGNLALEGEPDLRPGKLGIASERGEKDWTMVNNGGTPSGEVFFFVTD